MAISDDAAAGAPQPAIASGELMTVGGQTV